MTSPALTLHFAAGHRPDVDDIAALSARQADTTAFAITHGGDGSTDCVELLAMGLGFDLFGLAPGCSAQFLSPIHFFGVDASALDSDGGALRLVPGQHIATGRPMIPLLRVHAGLGAELATLPGLRAVGWEGARTMMSPAYFISAIRAWLVGGAFPALGLAALTRDMNGALVSTGLDLFCGFEVRVEPLPDESPQEAGRLAARVVHLLAEHGPTSLSSLRDAHGRAVAAETVQGQPLVRVWRQG